MSNGAPTLQPRDFGIGQLFWRIHEAVVMGDAASGRIVLWNPAAEALFGYSAAEALGQPIEMLMPEHLRPRHRAGLARYYATGHGAAIDTHAVLELPALRRTGEPLTIELTLSPVDEASADGCFVLAIIRDVSERKRAEEDRVRRIRDQAARGEAEEAQRRLAFLAEASKLLADSLDLETTLNTVVRLAMPTLADFGFFDVVEADGQVRRISHAHDDPGRQAILETTRWVRSDRTDLNLCALSSGASGFHSEVGEAWLADVATGPEHLALMRQLAFRSMITVPLLYQQRTLGALTLFFGDSGRHHSQSDLALAEELARRAAVAVENARLFKGAQEAIRARDEFLSVAAHELKTPIAGLRGFAQLTLRHLRRSETPDLARVDRALEVVDTQAGKLALLVSQLLDISRIEAGQLRLDRRQTDVTALAEEVVTAAQARTTNHTVRVRAPSPVRALVDPLRLEQVLTNLLDNAIKYSPKGGPVDVEVSMPGPETVRIAVADRGLGIPAEHRSHIFERFHQAHVAEHAGGMGLGLYVSREIVHLHGGQIEAEDHPGGGTRFVVTLPTGTDGVTA